MSTLRARIPRPLAIAMVAAALASANLLIGVGTAAGQKATLLAVLVGALPAMLIAFGALVESHRALLAWAALAITYAGIPFLGQRLLLPGGTSIFFTDVLLLLAIGAWLASRLSPGATGGSVRLSPAFSWLLVLLAVAILNGVLVGHERYGASIIAQPFRLVLYAGIALALTDTTPMSAWKAVTRVCYGGAVIQALFAVYYLATGTSQTDQVALSTGGVRVLALGTAMYLTGSLVCALLNLELERSTVRQLGHAAIAGLALFGIIVSFGRTTWAAAVLIIPLLLAARRYMRRQILVLLPLLAPVLVIAALLVPIVAPDLYPTLQKRITGTSSSDETVRWRELARDSALEGVEKEWLTGIGFGRVTQFRLRDQVIKIEGDPHNSFVYLLAGGGVLALGAFLLLSATYVVDAVRRLRRADAIGQALIVWALAFWLTFMVNATTGPVFTDAIMLMTIWVLIALPSVVPRGQPNPGTS